VCYSHDWYTSDNACAEPLDYAGRAIDTAVILFRANRAYICQLVEHLPGAWERYILFRWYFAQEARQPAVGAIFSGSVGDMSTDTVPKYIELGQE